MLLPKQVVTFKQLCREGFSVKEIKAMYVMLKLFPTPFKGIYYVPLEEERKSGVIESPLKVASQAISLFLQSKDFYFSCETAQEALGLNWRPSGNIHVVNSKLSRRIDIQARIERNSGKGSWRAKKISRILSFYGRAILFHKSSKINVAKTKLTPYGRFALKSQIKADLQRFKER